MAETRQAAMPPDVGPHAAVETAVAFACEGETLVGVVTVPTDNAADTGVLVIVGGPQYRAGSHRHFVTVARALAGAGWPAMRFDVRGMGDSTGALRSFEHLTPDIGAAIDEFFRRAPGLRRVVLWGLCDAASAALLYLDERHDARVAGLVLLNPWVRAAHTFARAQVRHYYARRLLDPAFWRALTAGRVGLASIADFAGALQRALTRSRPVDASAPAPDYPARMARAWLGFGGPSLLTLSGRDLTASEFVERSRIDAALGRACASARVTTAHLPEADHTLSDAGSATAHLNSLVQWLRTETASTLRPLHTG